MTLWEYGAVMHGWQERQPKDENTSPQLGDEPDADQWAEASVRADRLVRSFDSRDKG